MASVRGWGEIGEVSAGGFVVGDEFFDDLAAGGRAFDEASGLPSAPDVFPGLEALAQEAGGPETSGV